MNSLSLLLDIVIYLFKVFLCADLDKLYYVKLLAVSVRSALAANDDYDFLLLLSKNTINFHKKVQVVTSVPCTYSVCMSESEQRAPD